MNAHIRKRLRQLILMAWACALLGAIAMLGGAIINDHRINQDPGRALAHVTGTGIVRTTVEFQDAEGLYHSPASGLLYPTGLGEGQNVWVTYAQSNPDIVKVEGRSWTLAVIPATSVALVSTGIMGLLWWGAGAASARYSRR